MGLFSLLSLGVSTVFPIFASFRALEDCNSSKAVPPINSSLTNSVIALPLDFVFRRLASTGFSSLSPEDGVCLQSAQISNKNLQMWFIYWLVYGVILTGEHVLMLKLIIPFYDILKTGFSLWLMWPILYSNVHSDGTLRNKVEEEWKYFSRNGAGKVYYQYVVPALGCGMDTICNFNFRGLAHRIMVSVKRNRLGLSTFNSNTPKTTTVSTLDALRSWTLPKTVLSYLNFDNPELLRGGNIKSNPDANVPDGSYVVIENLAGQLEEERKEVNPIPRRGSWW